MPIYTERKTMSIKNKKFRVGDLVTRIYDYKIDSIPEAGHGLGRPYGIVLETNNGLSPSVLVYWFENLNSYESPRRLNSPKLLRLVNRA